MALPYVDPPKIPILPVQFYGAIVILALVGAAMTGGRLARRHGIPSDDFGLIAGLSMGACIITAHVFDVVVHQWDRAMDDPSLWWRVYDGVSLFGALFGVLIVLVVIASARRLKLAVHADVVAVS